ncbi:MAG: hypothetical protein RQ750_04385 [Roseovarius sp.]|nr:hypothetical protein [Roseovarius sp.]
MTVSAWHNRYQPHKPQITWQCLAMLWLSGCATGGSDVPLVVCPPVVEYSRAEQAQAVAEIEALPESAIVVGMLSDYAVLRDQSRACR